MFVVSKGGPGPLDISTGNLLRFDEHLNMGARLSGFLRPGGDWLQCRNLLFDKPGERAQPAGSVRLRFVEELDSLLVNFMPTGETAWGPDVIASKLKPAAPDPAEDQPPRQLCIECPSTQMSCAGIYSLVPQEQAHGMPLWRRSEGDRWLYCGSDGKWYVGGKLSHQKGFNCASGYLHCSELQPGALPHCLKGWCWGDGQQWHRDETICVREVPQPEKQLPELSKAEAATLTTKDLTEDGPGQYVIAHNNAAVTADVAVRSPTIVARLARGTRVCVLELQETYMNGRLRARISHPSGWISLAHAEDGYRWAYRQEDVLRLGGLPAVTDGRLKRCRSSVSTEEGSEGAGASGSSVCPSCSDGASEASSAARYAQLTTPSDSGSSAPSSHPGLTSDAPPRALRVKSPNGQVECAGFYVLVATERPNGQPVWEQSSRGGHWLYSGKTGKWCIGGRDVRDNNFDTAAGWLYQNRHHKGRMPQDVGGRWRRWNGQGFQEDDEIMVTLATPSMVPASSCSRGTSSIPSRGESVISSLSDSSASMQSPLQPSPKPSLPLSTVDSGGSCCIEGSSGSSVPSPPPSSPPSHSAAESELLDLRGSRLEERHRRVLEAGHVGRRLRVLI